MATFKPPQKKKKGSCPGYKPFPVPISTITQKPPSEGEWNFYDGHLAENCVLVKKRGDAQHLFQQGFFGKLLKVLKTEEKLESEENENTADNVEAVIDAQSSIATLSDEHLMEISQESSDKYVEIKQQFATGEIHSQLSFEESFFLSYALGCLFVLSQDSTKIYLSQQWKIFCDKDPIFPIRYAVYHHFRSKGWVPRDGIRYGADLTLYRKGPPFYHSSYILAIQVLDQKTLQLVDFNGVSNRTFSWVTLSALLRLATTVSKEVMLCYVLVPGDLTDEDKSSPECITKIQIQERIVSRWSSNKDRERELLDIDCDF